FAQDRIVIDHFDHADAGGTSQYAHIDTDVLDFGLRSGLLFRLAARTASRGDKQNKGQKPGKETFFQW
ncbi:MAG: hypothetical protein H6Q64_127, partial [Firmicutes bacterium]|nr:hypothetical protein [Bacillota bacterium]